MYPKHYLDYFRDFERTDEVFVAMPFRGDDADYRWTEIFQPAIEAVDLDPYRVDTRDVGDSILTDILEGIGRARLVLGDVSGQGTTQFQGKSVGRPNPNAVYELGIAHAARLETEVVVVRAEREDTENERVPFDLLHIRHHTFDPYEPEAATDFVAGLLSGALEEIDRTRDLIVDRTIRRLDGEGRTVLRQCVKAGGSLEEPSLDLGERSGDRIRGDSFLILQSNNRRRRDILRRLTELGLLKVHSDSASTPVVYSVTTLGYAVASRLGIEES